MKHLFTLLLLVACGYLSAQAEISATVMDTTGTTLPGANAVLLRSSDSLLTAFATTDNKGVFLMQNVAPGKYLLRVTFLGYERPDQDIEITPDDQYLGLSDIKMYPAGFFLNGVEVTADRIPIRMKGDTMMYNADAFAVGENAVVEDLLRRLPGMAVDASGQITWRGKPISEVMINGKPFFAGNSTLLTQNLDAKAISNVEVYDQKTDNEEITGVDDGTENMTVNLEMKDDFKAKVFGELYAGYGTQERYQAGGKTFRISDVTQIGVLGTINNVNKVGFSGDEISGFNGSSGRGRSFSFGGGDGQLPFDDGSAAGQNRSIAAGVNFGRSIGKDGQLTMDYALFDRNQLQEATTLQAFNQTRNSRITETMEGNAANSYSHRLGFDLRQRLDSTSRLRIDGSLFLTGGDNNTTANTIIKQNGADDLDYSVLDRSEVDQPGGNLDLRYNRRLGKKEGRTFRIGLGGSYQENQNDTDVLTEGLEESLAIPVGALQNGRQLQNRLTTTTGLNGNLNFTEPLSDKWRLSLGTSYNYNNAEGDFRFQLEEQAAANLLDRTWSVLGGSVGMVHPFGKGNNLSFGTNYNASTLDLAGDEVRNTNYNFLLPYARLRMRLKKGFFSAGVSSNAQAPSVGQLQTIARPGTTGRVTIGNPNLEPAVNTRFSSFL
ncbi:MAG: TonB-dependent receptor, partial [Bacteroidota bacterium]